MHYLALFISVWTAMGWLAGFIGAGGQSRSLAEGATILKHLVGVAQETFSTPQIVQRMETGSLEATQGEKGVAHPCNSKGNGATQLTTEPKSQTDIIILQSQTP